MVGATLGVSYNCMVADLVGDALQGRNGIRGIDLSTSSTHDLRHPGVGANHRNRCEVLTLKWKHLLFVPEQNTALCTCLTYQGAMFGQIGALLWLLLLLLKEARFDQQLQQATHACLNGRFLNLAPFDGLQQLLTPPLWLRHLQIESGIHRGSRALDRPKPVGHHHANIPPLTTKDLR